jgi:hypothetical protein
LLESINISLFTFLYEPPFINIHYSTPFGYLLDDTVFYFVPRFFNLINYNTQASVFQ